jgi:nucleotide-binding universal stress UspA family protein
VTELIGVHALFGAFLFGAVLPKEGGFARALADKLEDLVLVVLLPLFFAYSGLRTQLSLLSSAEALALCGVIIVLACAGKFGASALAARITGLSWREASALGVLMNTRGLMELIVLNVGFDLHVIGPQLFTMMVMMALVTTFMTTPILHVIYPPEQRTLELAEPREAVTTAQYTVLVCIADPRIGPNLVTLAAALCPRENARVYALRLVSPSERGSFSDEATEQLAQLSLAPILERARALSLPVKPLSFVSTDASEDISSVAQVKGADLVLIGSHRPVLGQRLLGGLVYRVLRETPSAVGVLMNRGLNELRRVLVPFMGTPHDQAALELARRMLETSATRVTVLHVVDPARHASVPGLGARDAVSTAFHEANGAEVEFRVVESDAPADAVLAEAAAGYDLVVVGLGRDWGLEPRAFGIQRERLLVECPISLLVVRQAITAAERALQAKSAGSGPDHPKPQVALGSE